MTTELDGEPVVALDLNEFRIGAWTAMVEVDAEDLNEEPITGLVTLDIEGLEFIGTVIEGEIEGDSRWKGFMIGGRDGLRGEIEGVHYVAPSVSTILADLATATGEELADDISPDILGKRLPRYTRMKGPAHCAVRSLADLLGVDWRIKRDGTLWFGEPAWTEVETEQEIIEEDTDIQEARITVSYDQKVTDSPIPNPASENETPDAEPGFTLDGRRIQEARTYIDDTMRQDLFFDSDFQTAEDRAQAQVRPLINHSRNWPGKLGGQALDGSVIVNLDDSLVGGRWGNMDRVPVVFGIPGVTIESTKGARCRVWFDGGDQSRARVGLFDAGAPVAVINFAVSSKLRLGSDSAAQAYVLGTKHIAELTTYVTALGVLIGTIAPPPSGLATYITAEGVFKTHLGATALSTKVFGE